MPYNIAANQRLARPIEAHQRGKALRLAEGRAAETHEQQMRLGGQREQINQLNIDAAGKPKQLSISDLEKWNGMAKERAMIPYLAAEKARLSGATPEEMNAAAQPYFEENQDWGTKTNPMFKRDGDGQYDHEEAKIRWGRELEGEEGDDYTLSPGSKRYGPNGQIIAENQAASRDGGNLTENQADWAAVRGYTSGSSGAERDRAAQGWANLYSKDINPEEYGLTRPEGVPVFKEEVDNPRVTQSQLIDYQENKEHLTRSSELALLGMDLADPNNVGLPGYWERMKERVGGFFDESIDQPAIALQETITEIQATSWRDMVGSGQLSKADYLFIDRLIKGVGVWDDPVSTRRTMMRIHNRVQGAIDKYETALIMNESRADDYSNIFYTE